MAKHHHHSKNPQTSATATPQSPIYIAIISILPPIFYLISLSLTLKVIYTPAFALLPYFNSSGLDIGVRGHASPFYVCTAVNNATSNPIDTKNGLGESCVRKPQFMGKKGMDWCLANELHGAWPDFQYCQQSTTSAGLYVAGAVLVGIAIIAAVVFAALNLTKGSKNGETGVAEPDHVAVSTGTSVLTTVLPFVRVISALLALLAVLCIVSGQAVGISVMIAPRLSLPGEALPAYSGSWYIGPAGLVYSSVAWLSGVLGSFIALAFVL